MYFDGLKKERNINTVVGSRMTNEELDRLIEEMSGGIEKLNRKDLTKAEKRRRQGLTLKKGALIRVKAARAEDRKRDETSNLALYGFLNIWGEKHPILVNLMMGRFRNNIL